MTLLDPESHAYSGSTFNLHYLWTGHVIHVSFGSRTPNPTVTLTYDKPTFRIVRLILVTTYHRLFQSLVPFHLFVPEAHSFFLYQLILFWSKSVSTTPTPGKRPTWVLRWYVLSRWLPSPFRRSVEKWVFNEKRTNLGTFYYFGEDVVDPFCKCL